MRILPFFRYSYQESPGSLELVMYSQFYNERNCFWLFCLLIKVTDYIGDYIFVPKEKLIYSLCQKGVKS